jgi:hypothetical protein
VTIPGAPFDLAALAVLQAHVDARWQSRLLTIVADHHGAASAPTRALAVDAVARRSSALTGMWKGTA